MATVASKYKSLTDFLRASEQDEILLTFAEVERILGATLPQTAYKSPAWWANSRTRDTHGWAHQWLAGGWASSNVDLKRRTVIFRRGTAGSKDVSAIAGLYPKRLEHLMDLLVQAEIDVNAWGFTAEGRAVTHPKANPDYCYDWSFGSEDEGFVLCVWCDLLDDSGLHVTYRENMQQLARDLERAGREKGLDQEKRSRVQQQARRARAFDDALDFSYRKGRTVRVILTAGDRRSRDEIVEKSSKVALRTLDDASWYVHRYSRDTGECLLVRGVPPAPEPPLGSQEADDSDDSPGADDDRRVREVARRRGQAEFRQSLLAAYSRRCAVTGSAVVELLEAAHVIPHSEGRNYRVTNGLLLRADIHTLFDLYLLSVDTRGQIHISKTLVATEYWQYHGKPMANPAGSFRDQPHAVSLQSRHERFLAREPSRL
jgi:hypothetical protein